MHIVFIIVVTKALACIKTTAGGEAQCILGSLTRSLTESLKLLLNVQGVSVQRETGMWFHRTGAPEKLKALPPLRLFEASATRCPGVVVPRRVPVFVSVV